jgi:hypothetical protein
MDLCGKITPWPPVFDDLTGPTCAEGEGEGGGGDTGTVAGVSLLRATAVGRSFESFPAACYRRTIVAGTTSVPPARSVHFNFLVK